MQDSNTGLAPVVVPPTPLSAQHHHMLAVESGSAPALMTARGSRTITRKADLGALDWARLVPVSPPYGALGLAQTRPDAPGDPPMVAGARAPAWRPRDLLRAAAASAPPWPALARYRAAGPAGRRA